MKSDSEGTRKAKFFGILILLVVALYFGAGKDFLNLQYVQARLEQLSAFEEARPAVFLSLFCGIYILITSLAVPGSIVLTLLGGAIFGPVTNALIVTTAGGVGALVSFLLGRYFLRDFVKEKFNRAYRTIKRRSRSEGKLYLFGLRLVPVSPYVVINLVAGVTHLKAWDFFWITYLGMFPGNFIYSYAGKKILEIQTVREILSPEIILALLALGAFPLVFRIVMQRWVRRT